MGLCNSSAVIAPTAGSPRPQLSYLITEHVKQAAHVLLKYPLFCDAFLAFVLSGKWVPDFLDSNPNLFSVLNRPDSETQFQLLLNRTNNVPSTPSHHGGHNNGSFFANNNSHHSSTIIYLDGHIEGSDGSGHSHSHGHGGKNPLLELNVEWIQSFTSTAAEPLLAIVVACAFPLFLQSRDFEVWHELLTMESPSQAELGSDILHDTMMFRLVDNASYDVLQSNEDENHELKELEGTFTTVLHPCVKHITFAHRPKSVRESVSRRVAHRANRIEAIIRFLLGLAPYNGHSYGKGKLFRPGSIAASGTDSPLYQSLRAMFPSVAAPTVDAASGASPPVSPRVAQDCPWLHQLQTFLDQLKVPVFIARVANHHHQSTFFGRWAGGGAHASPFAAEQHHFTVVAANAAYLDVTRRAASDILGRTVYELVLEHSHILSQHCPARGPAADSALSTLYPLHFLLESRRGDGSAFPNLFMLKPVHHVLAHPSHHYLVAIQYDLSPPLTVGGGPSEKSFLTSSSRTRSDAAMLGHVTATAPGAHVGGGGGLAGSVRPAPINTSVHGAAGVGIAELSPTNATSPTPPVAHGSAKATTPLRRSVSEMPTPLGHTRHNSKSVTPGATTPLAQLSSRGVADDVAAVATAAATAAAIATSPTPAGAASPASPTPASSGAAVRPFPALHGVAAKPAAAHHPIISPLLHKLLDTSPRAFDRVIHLHRPSAASSAATASGTASGATKYVAEADHGAEAKATAPTTTTALSFQSLEQDMPMIEDVLNLLPHLLF
eukprot:gene7914-5689_t